MVLLVLYRNFLDKRHEIWIWFCKKLFKARKTGGFGDGLKVVGWGILGGVDG